MVKNVLIVFSLLMLAACSGKGTDVELKVSKSFAIAAQTGGGAVLYISNPDTKDAKTIVVENEEVTITLLNGNWEFSVVTWNGTTPLAGDLACAKESAVLRGEKVEIDLQPSIQECMSPNFSKKEVSFVNCNSLSGLASGETCDGPARGQAGSYQIIFETPGNKILRSACVEAAAAPVSTVDTNISLPFGYIKDFKFDLFSDASCLSGKITYSHSEAFNDGSVLYFSYGAVISSPPIAEDISYAGNFNLTSINIELPYQVQNSDVATSCEILSYNNVSPIGCSCVSGTCTASFSGSSYGTGTFQYQVTALGQASNTATVSFEMSDVAILVYQGTTTATVGSPLNLSPIEFHPNGSNPSCNIFPGLPAGLTFDSFSCSVTGVPSEVSGSTYTVTAINNAGSSTTNFTLTVNPLPPTLSYSGALTQSFYTGLPLSIIPMLQENGSPIIACSITPSLPIGLTIDNYCSISGTTTLPVDMSYTVTATNAAGSASAGVPLKIGSPFISEWKTTTASEMITLPLVASVSYNFKVDWGDGSYSDVVSWDSPDRIHVYLYPGNYIITIYGNIPQLKFNGAGDKSKILNISQWGTSKWVSMEHAFFGCSNLQVTATDAPDLTMATSLLAMFRDASIFNGTIGHWNTGSITDMSYMFKGASSFNQNISSWNTSNVTNMSYMFSYAGAFNQPLGNWDTSSVTNMSAMFENASIFNQPLPWVTSKVTNMSMMFLYASAFNQPLNWDTSLVTVFDSMFSNATNFNQNLTMWNVSSEVSSTYFASATNPLWTQKPLFQYPP